MGYWACVRKNLTESKKEFDWDGFGIRPVTDRWPSRRVGASREVVSLDDAQQLLPSLPALPTSAPPQVPSHMPAPPPRPGVLGNDDSNVDSQLLQLDDGSASGRSAEASDTPV